MVKKSKKTVKPVTEDVSVNDKPRRLKVPQYQRGKFQKRLKHPGPKLESSWKILRRSLGDLRRNQALFGGILAIYTFVSLILVKGFGQSAKLSEYKSVLQSSNSGTLKTGSDLLGSLFTTAGSSTAGSSTYQTILFIVMSLVIIWALRQGHGKKLKQAPIKAAFYKSMNPLIPFVLVLLVLCVELIPLLIGTTLYTLIINGGIAVSALERLVSLAMLFIFATWSVYMMAGTLFALYIVTLPDATPMQALRSAKELVRLRRWTIIRKVIFLPVVLVVVLSLIMLPVVLLLTGVAEWIFFVLSLAAVIIGHSYYYNLYRELM